MEGLRRDGRADLGWRRNGRTRCDGSVACSGGSHAPPLQHRVKYDRVLLMVMSEQARQILQTRVKSYGEVGTGHKQFPMHNPAVVARLQVLRGTGDGHISGKIAKHHLKEERDKQMTACGAAAHKRRRTKTIPLASSPELAVNDALTTDIERCAQRSLAKECNKREGTIDEENASTVKDVTAGSSSSSQVFEETQKLRCRENATCFLHDVCQPSNIRLHGRTFSTAVIHDNPICWSSQSCSPYTNFHLAFVMFTCPPARLTSGPQESCGAPRHMSPSARNPGSMRPRHCTLKYRASPLVQPIRAAVAMIGQSHDPSLGTTTICTNTSSTAFCHSQLGCRVPYKACRNRATCRGLQTPRGMRT